jgi:sugar transferase (PEP-CTERM/EpsH1 system associated)
VQLFKLLRRLQPAILHTYNLGTIEYAFTAALAGVPARVHAEHGRDARDPNGANRKHNLLRRMLVPFIDRYVPVSSDLRRWLAEVVGIPESRNQFIGNGVDTQRFCRLPAGADPYEPWMDPDAFVIGTVGRLQDVKDHATLIDAFARLYEMMPSERARLRLVIVGDGPLRGALADQVVKLGLRHCVWLAGARSDVACAMRSFSLFAMSSIAEGTPVTLLEAMATELPVVATRVGGIPELVQDGVTGTLVSASDPAQMARAMLGYVMDAGRARSHGLAGRARVEQHYSIAAMLDQYVALYDELCKTKTTLEEAITPCAE